ncbi:MAG TPA: hypothetical protein VNT75_21200 [Symbiobacteriaceae bacterium]|nr:hypothetical protein [Symbiobacteriaceae bacterium]
MALSQREKRLLLIPAGLAVLFAFYNLVHVPLFARRAEAAGQQEKVSTELRKGQSKLVQERDLRVRKEAVTAREKVIDAWVPGKNSAAMLIWYLSQVELQSGARIRGISVTEKKQVTAAPQQPGAQPAQPQAAPKTTGSAPAQGSQVAATQAAPGQPQPSADPAAPAPMLTVVQLELKVDARFAQHMQFNQGIEEMPLFLNTDALSIAKEEPLPLEQVSKLVQGGNSTLAAQLLSLSPTLKGSYKLNLYFKADKQGPLTDTMHFSEEAGRSDPYANVDEFVDTTIRFFSSQPGPDGSRGPLPTLPDDLKGQLG